MAMQTMRREQLFSREGFYRFIVTSNVLLHREAIVAGADALGEYLRHRSGEGRVRVLDLACGGEPVTISALMERFPETVFEYTGVDINPDQIALAGEFAFPANVARVELLEGSAWDLRDLPLADDYDLVFMGMNLHHGTPEEIWFLASQIQGRLAEGGLFLNHDWFRPEGEPYLRRPDSQPGNPEESFLLVDRATLAEAGVPAFMEAEIDAAQGDALWRETYRSLLRDALVDRGGDPGGAESTYRHVGERDYPIALSELERILAGFGFSMQAGRFDGDDPLMDYTFLVVARRA